MTKTMTSEKPKRVRHVFPTREVAHIWARQTQQSGRNATGNLFFEGGIIYSYGHHFPIARFVRPDVVLFTTRGYSNTTAKHIGQVRQAIPDSVQVINCDNVLANNTEAHKRNLIAMWEDLVSACEGNARARKYDSSDWIAHKLTMIDHYTRWSKIGRTKRLATLMDSIESPRPLLWGRIIGLDDEETAAINAKKTAAVIDEEEKREAKQRVENEKYVALAPLAIAAWRKGERHIHVDGVRQYASNILYHLPTALRLNSDGSRIETSHGATISVETAKRIWPILKARQVPEDIEGYRSVGFDKSDELVVGCHRIPFGELELMAQQLGLESSLEKK